MSVACTHRYTSETIAKRNHGIIIERMSDRFSNASPRTVRASLNAYGSPSVLTQAELRVVDEVKTGRADYHIAHTFGRTCKISSASHIAQELLFYSGLKFSGS